MAVSDAEEEMTPEEETQGSGQEQQREGRSREPSPGALCWEGCGEASGGVNAELDEILESEKRREELAWAQRARMAVDGRPSWPLTIFLKAWRPGGPEEEESRASTFT